MELVPKKIWAQAGRSGNPVNPARIFRISAEELELKATNPGRNSHTESGSWADFRNISFTEQLQDLDNFCFSGIIYLFIFKSIS